MRAENGAEQNRVMNTINLLQTNVTNLEAAHGRIMDADIALESTRFARQNVLVQPECINDGTYESVDQYRPLLYSENLSVKDRVKEDASWNLQITAFCSRGMTTCLRLLIVKVTADRIATGKRLENAGKMSGRFIRLPINRPN